MKRCGTRRRITWICFILEMGKLRSAVSGAKAMAVSASSVFQRLFSIHLTLYQFFEHLLWVR